MASEKEWTGKELAKDLARHLTSPTCMVWVEAPLGSVWQGVQRADVLAINKSYTNPNVRIYEIKVSRGDFFGDINRDKYTGYKKNAHQVYFAVPSKLIQVTELPQDGVGLIVRNESSWHVAKAARRIEYKLDVELLLKLLMKGYEDHWQKPRLEGKTLQDIKVYSTLRQAYYDYGVKVGKDIADAQQLVQAAESFKREIGKLMGKDYDKPMYAVSELQADVRGLMNQKKYSRLALPLSKLCMNLFEGNVYINPVRELEILTEQAKKEFSGNADC